MARQYCITCPRSDWRAIRALAERAGMRTSPYIVGRVLKREGFGAGEGGHALVLDGKRQRGMLDAALGAAATVGPERAAGIARRAAMRAGGGETAGAG